MTLRRGHHRTGADRSGHDWSRLVTAAKVQDHDGAIRLLTDLKDRSSRVTRVRADSDGDHLVALDRADSQAGREIAKRSQDIEGLQVLHRHLVVERALAWPTTKLPTRTRRRDPLRAPRGHDPPDQPTPNHPLTQFSNNILEHHRGKHFKHTTRHTQGNPYRTCRPFHSTYLLQAQLRPPFQSHQP